MVIHSSLALCTVTSLFVGGVAFAQQTGTTTGPSAGKNVEPSTTTEKGYESEQQRLERGAVGGIGGGRPGVEAMPGTQGGAEGRPGK
jgi:hypothetical protein